MRNIGEEGFTLLEVMVSLALCGVIAVLAYQSLSVASDAAQRSQEKMVLIQKLDYTLSQLQRDLQHAVVGVSYSDSPAFEGRQPLASIKGSAQPILIFSRQGWQNPLQRQRSDIQRIRYSLQDNTLYRHYELVEQSVMSTPDAIHKQLLLEGIESLNIRFLPIASKSLSTDSWLDYWPDDAKKNSVHADSGLPLAMQLEINHQVAGTVSRLFYLPAAMR